MKNNKKKSNFLTVVIVLVIVYALVSRCTKLILSDYGNDDNEYNDKTFSIIASNDNKILDSVINDYAKKNKYDISIDYYDTLEIIDKLNSGKKYDAILISNSIYLSMLDSSKVKTTNLRSTSITPVIFGIKSSLADSLGFKNKKVYTSDILREIKNGNIKFSMANPLTTNSGVSAYLEVLTNLAGNPEVLTLNHLENESLKTSLKEFFKGITRTSGDEDFLETSFINGDYDAAFTYESSIININKELEKNNKETLYAIYPVDGVAISDSPFVFIDNKNEKKKEVFLSLQEYLLSNEGQNVLLNSGKRTWYGGINKNAPKDVFNPSWGINTTEYITPIKYPSITVLNKALSLYQSEFRKPIHVVFCLDYSGSMYGKGLEELKKAMREILTTTDYTISFSDKDKIDVIPFGTKIIDTWSTSDGLSREDILRKIEETELDGSTALYPAAIEAINLLYNAEAFDKEEYVYSVILMTDGQANVGSFYDLQNRYRIINREYPIYSITFGDADERELLEISELTNGKVFDGKDNLLNAFKKVRGYN